MQLTLDLAPLATWRAHTRDIDPTFVRDLIADVLTETAAHLTILEHACTTRDTAACRSIAHRLKSSFNAVGAFRLAVLFEGMEVLATGGAVLFLSDQAAEIRAEYDRLQAALQQEQRA